MAINSKKNVKKKTGRSFFAKDFDAFKADLLREARTYFPDKISDFSEPSVAGLFLDMASSIGDSLSFYLDHSFSELDPIKSVEPQNIVTHMRNAGLEVVGASPSSVVLTVSITVPAEKKGNDFFPKMSCLPIILANTSFISNSGVSFLTTEDIDFSRKNKAGNLIANYSVRSLDDQGAEPASFDVSIDVVAVSGKITEEVFNMGDHSPFTSISLTNSNISSIISVTDSEGDDYYEVESLSQDNVFVPVDNFRNDSDLVSHNLELMPAPRRYIRRNRFDDRGTTIVFGSGDAEIFDDDILPDPSDVSLELFGKKSIERFSIDPNSLLKTQTLGVAPSNTTITVRYRFGGGLSHNVAANSINSIETLIIEFRNKPEGSEALAVRQSIRSNNELSSKGGTDAPSLTALKSFIPTARNSQMRIVTREDLLARIYTFPSKFGRVYRAAFEKNRSNPLSGLLFICSIDSNGNITTSPDSLKLNLSRYLNEYRVISDAMDILDAKVINFGVKYEVMTKEETDRISIINSINSEIAFSMRRDNFQIGQPIVFDDITNIIINTPGVLSLVSLRIIPRVGNIEGREYSGATFPFEESVKYGILRGPLGSIFELKFPQFDISGNAV